MPILPPVTPNDARRRLHLGDKGSDVLAYQRMLTRTLASLKLVSVNRQGGLYGQGTLRDTLRLQRTFRFVSDGVVDAQTWSHVDAQMHAYERWLLRLKPPPPAPVGDRIAHHLEAMYVLRLNYYTQARPAARAEPFPWKAGADCSGSYLLARSLALGLPYDGWGNTGTIWANYAHVAPTDVRNGDAALYGQNDVTTHVQGVVDAKSLMTVGFGNAPGTRAPVSYRFDFMGYRRGA